MPHFPKPFFRPSRKRWYVQLDGKQINLGPDKEAAFDRYHEFMRQSRTATAKVPPQAFVVIADHFLQWVQSNRAADTYEWYRYRIQRFIDAYPEMLAKELKPHHVETWADGYGLSVTSKRNYLRSVKRCMKWARKQGYIDVNPIADIEVPACEAKEVYIPPDDFDRLVAATRSRNVLDLLEVTYTCGCRPQELLRVTANEVDMANERWVFARSRSKGKRISRVVYLSATAMEITRRRRGEHPSSPLPQ